MIIAEITKNTPMFTVHASRAEAAQFIVDDLGRDYDNDFWIEDGELAEGERCLDFSCAVHNGVAEVVREHECENPEVLARILRDLATLVEKAE